MFTYVLVLLLIEVTYSDYLTTPDQFVAYQFIPVIGNSVRFRIKATDEVYLALTSGPEESNPMYEFCIGCWKNTKTTFKRSRAVPYKVGVEIPGILSGDEFRGFWVRWDSNGNTYAGKEGETAPFILWHDSEPFPIGYFGIGTGLGAKGIWDIEGIVGTPDQYIAYQFFPVSGNSIQFKLQATDEAYLALTSGPEESDPMYEFCIGCWKNTRTTFKRNRSLPYKVQAELPGILSGKEFRGFWVRWDGNGNTYAGREGETRPFILWHDPEPFPIGYFGIGTGLGAKGTWDLRGNTSNKTALNLNTTTIATDVSETYRDCPPRPDPPSFNSLCCGGQAVNTADRIIGGNELEAYQYPWLALLEYDDHDTKCGGTLISNRYVLTAAHCLEGIREVKKVRLAEYDKSTYPTDKVEIFGVVKYLTVIVIDVERRITHPEFKRVHSISYNDIALLKLRRNAPYNEYVRPICLPVLDITKITRVVYFTVAGWGTNGTHETNVKRHVTLPYVPLKTCQGSFSSPRNYVSLKETQLCAGGVRNEDSCRGDSGGPLMYFAGGAYVLVGVVSFGHFQCGTEGAPGVYTYVYKYLDWIKQNTV